MLERAHRPGARGPRDGAALGFDAVVELALRDCDYGRWRGLASKDVAQREPDAFAAWLGNPASAPHGGELIAALIERVGAWLTQSLAHENATLAVTHASVVRAAIVNALGAGPQRSRGSMSRRSRLRGSAVMLDAGILWRSALWEACRDRRLDRPHCALCVARCVAEPSAPHLHPRRTASGRRLHTESHAWPDGGDPRQSPRDPRAGQRQAGFDLTTWRLEDYLNLQSFACLWGIVPGSIADEESPFNECAHAYLAAGRALLLQLAEEPSANHKAIDALTSKIEVEMLADGASMNLCRYSDEPFNTNEIIWPHWSMALSDPPTLATLGAVFALIAGSIMWLGRRDKRSAGLPQPSA